MGLPGGVQAIVRSRFTPGATVSSGRASAPERPACQLRSLSGSFQLGPCDLRVATQSETTVGRGDDPLAPDQVREALDPCGHELRVLDQRCRMTHHSRGQKLVIRQSGPLPDNILVLVTQVRCFEEICLCVDGQQCVDHIRERNVTRVGAVPASPAQVMADLFGRNALQSMIQRFHAHRAIALVACQPHLHADAIPECRESGVIYLEQQSGPGDRLVLHANRFCEREDKLLLRFVVQILPAGLETGGRG
jgi:hypothetical protein